jgi:hypothetical protein
MMPLVPEVGLEPTSPFERWILRLNGDPSPGAPRVFTRFSGTRKWHGAHETHAGTHRSEPDANQLRDSTLSPKSLDSSVEFEAFLDLRAGLFWPHHTDVERR